jgi:chloramphenicol 3-O phosphotransferase
MTHVIILNGASSSGKSSIAQELQKILPTPHLHFQMDAFWDMVPPNIEANSQNFPHIKPAIIDSAHALLKHGHSLIIDIVFIPDIKQIISRLKDFAPYTVAITADLETLKKRELTRKNRDIGLCESQYLLIHKDTKYDLEIDTTHMSAEKSAGLIVKNMA